MEQTRKKVEKGKKRRKERLSISFSLDFKEGRAGPSDWGKKWQRNIRRCFFKGKMANLEPAYTKVFKTNESPLRLWRSRSLKAALLSPQEAELSSKLRPTPLGGRGGGGRRKKTAISALGKGGGGELIAKVCMGHACKRGRSGFHQ